MSFIVTFIAAVFVFSAVIAIHEFGHFMVAKLCGVQVNEFSIGMGPVLCKRVRKGTQYSIRALPVGGFVALEGEESPESKQAEERSNPSAADGGSSPDRGALGIAETSPEEEKPAGIPLNEAPVWQRALIMLAGAGMNFVLGFVVMAILITAQSEPITSKVLYQVEENALCGQTGLQAGDKILAVNGRRCFVANDILYELMRTEDYTADFTVLRDGKKVELKKIFPFFILYFILASVITTAATALGVPASVFSPLKTLSKFLIVLAMSAIGLNTNIVKLIRTGGKPLGLGFCCWVGIAGMSLLMQHILGLW